MTTPHFLFDSRTATTISLLKKKRIKKEEKLMPCSVREEVSIKESLPSGWLTYWLRAAEGKISESPMHQPSFDI